MENLKKNGSSYLRSPGDYHLGNVLTKEAVGLTLEMTPGIWGSKGAPGSDLAWMCPD